MNSNDNKDIEYYGQQLDNYQTQGLKAQIRLLKRLLFINYEELVEFLGVEKTLISNETAWKQKIDQLKSKLEVQYNKSDRAIQVEIVSNLFLFALKYGMNYIKINEIFQLIKDKINGKPSVNRSRAILLIINILISKFQQALTYEQFLELDQQAFEDALHIANIVYKDEINSIEIRKIGLVHCSRLMTSICLFCFIKKNNHYIQVLNLSILLVQKCQELDNLNNKEKQEFQFILINLMKRSIKECSGYQDSQYKIKVQNTLKYIENTKEMWKKQLIDLQNEQKQPISNNYFIDNLLDFEKTQENEIISEIKSLQNFLIKIEQIEQEINKTGQKVNNKQFQSLHKYVLQDMNEQLKSEENKSLNLSQSQNDKYQDYQLISYLKKAQKSKLNRKTSSNQRQQVTNYSKICNIYLFQKIFFKKESQIQGKRQATEKQQFSDYFVFQRQESNQQKFQQYGNSEEEKIFSQDSQLIQAKVDQQQEQQEIKQNEEEFKIKENNPTNGLSIFNKYQKQIFKLQNKSQEKQTKSQNIYQQLQERRFSSVLNLNNRNQIPIQTNKNDELQKEKSSQNFQELDNSPFFLPVSPIQRKKSALLSSKQLTPQNNLQQSQDENEYFCLQINKADSQQNGENLSKASQSSNQDQKLEFQLNSLKNSIYQVKKQSSTKQENQENTNTDTQSARTRKSGIISSQNKKKYKSPPQTYLSSSLTYQSHSSGNQFNKQASILEQYNVTNKSNFHAQQFRETDKNKTDSNKFENNILLDYFGENFQQDQCIKQEGGFSIKSQRICQTQMNSPNLRNIKSARDQNQSPSINSFQNYQKLDMQNGYFFSKPNNSFINLRKKSIIQNNKNDPQTNRKGLLFNDMLLTQSLSNSLQTNPVSPFIKCDNKQKSNSLTPRDEKLFSSSTQGQLQSSYNQIKSQSNAMYSSTDSIKVSLYQNALNDELVNKQKSQKLINSSDSSQADQNKYLNNCQNMIKIIQTIDESQKDQNNQEMPQQISNLILSKQQSQNQTAKESKSFAYQIQKYLKEKPQIRNILNKIRCSQKEKVFLQQAQQIQDVKKEVSQINQEITPQNNAVSIVLSKKNIGTDIYDEQQSDAYNSQKQIKYQQQNLKIIKSNSSSQNTNNDNEIVSLKNIQSIVKENKSSKFIKYQEESCQNISKYSFAVINSQVKQTESMQYNHENSKIKQQESNNSKVDNCSDLLKKNFDNFQLGVPEYQNNQIQSKSQISALYSQISSKKKKNDLEEQNNEQNSKQFQIDVKKWKNRLNTNNKSIYQNYQTNQIAKNNILFKKVSKTNYDLPYNLEKSDEIYQKVENQPQGESQEYQQNKSSWIFKRIANRIQEQSNYAEKILQKENSIQSVPKIIIPSNQDSDNSISLQNDEKLDINSKQNLSEIRENQNSLSLSSKSQIQDSKSPIEKDSQAHQSFQDYIKLNSNQKSQFAQQQKLENSFEKIYKMNLSTISNLQTPKNQSNKQSNQASPATARMDLQKNSLLKSEDNNYKIKLQLMQERSFKAKQTNSKELSQDKNLDNSRKKLSVIKSSQTIKDLTSFSSQNKLKSQFLAVPQNGPINSQKRSSIQSNQPQDFSQILKNISRSFKIPQWAEKNQRRFPSYFNYQINTVQKKLYNIIECFKIIFILNKFFKKIIKRIRLTLQLKKQAEEQKLKAQRIVKRNSTKEKPLQIKNLLRNSLVQNKIAQSQSLTQSLFQQDLAENELDEDSQLLSKKESLQIIRILKLKQFKEKAAQVSSGMNEQGEPFNKLIGFYPSLKFSSFIGNKIHVWKIYYVHKQNTSAAKISDQAFGYKNRNQTETKEENLENPSEFQFQVKIDDQILKYSFKLSQNLVNILPGNNLFCTTLWPSAFWMFFHNLQNEQSFNIENDQYLNVKRQSVSSSFDTVSPIYEQNPVSFKDEIDEDNLECVYDDITYKIYETQNNLKFLNFQANKQKKIFELQDIEYIGKLSYLLQQFGINKGRIVSKISGKTVIFQDLPYDQPAIKYYKSMLGQIKRYNIYFNEFQQSQSQVVDSTKKNEDQITKYLNSQKSNYQLQIGLRKSIVNLIEERIVYLQQNQINFDKYFSYLQSKPHHILNMFLKKNKSYFLLSANLVFKYDLFQKYQSDKKIPFSIYVMARNMDMNSRVKPIEISQDKLLYFFSEHQIQQEIKRGSISKFWKINLIQICSMTLEIMTNYQSGKQIGKNSKFNYYDQELYVKDSLNQIFSKDSYLRNNEMDEGQISYGAISDGFFIGSEQSQIERIQLLNKNQNIFNKNFDEIYQKFYMQKREQQIDYNEIDIYSKDYQIKNDFDIIQEKLQNDSDEEDQRKVVLNKLLSPSLPKEVQLEIESKYQFSYAKSQSKIFLLLDKLNFFPLILGKTIKDNKKLTERLNNYLKERGQIYKIKNQSRGINFLFQVLSKRNYDTLLNKYRDQAILINDYIKVQNNNNCQKQTDQIFCFLYDYERKQRYFIIIQDKKQIKLLINIIEMNLEGFLMENSIVKNLQTRLLQGLFMLKPDTNRYLKIQKYLKNINLTQREKKLRIDCPISVQYHLIVDSKQINNFYHNITRSYTLNFKELGKCFVNASLYQIKSQDNSSQVKFNNSTKEDENSLSSSHQLLSLSGSQKQQNLDNKHTAFLFSTLLVLHIMPTNQRYKAYRLILSLADLRDMDIILFKHFQKDFFKESMLQRLVKLVSQQIVKIKTILGSVLALSADRIQTIHSASGKKVVLRLSRFNPYQEEELMQKNSTNINFMNNNLESRSKFLTYQEEENLSRLENKKWRVFIKQLKYTKNKVLKHEYELNDTVFRKKLMHEIIEPRRIILQKVQKFFDQEYTLITVLRDVLKNIFVIKIYIPKTCRTILVQFDMENLKQINASIFNEWIQLKLLFFHQNNQIPPFSSFQYFSQRISATREDQLQQIFENESKIRYFVENMLNNVFQLLIELEKSQLSIFKWQKINSEIQKKNDHKIPFFNIGTPKSIMKKKLFDELKLSNFSNSVQRCQSVNKKVDFEDFQSFSSQAKNIIEGNMRQKFKRSQQKRTCILPRQVQGQIQLFFQKRIIFEIKNKRILQKRRNIPDIIRDKLQLLRFKPQNLINYFKTDDMIKKENYLAFQQITSMLDQGFQQRIENIQISNMTRFIEMQIWDNIIGDIYFLPNDLKKDIMIMIGDSSFQVQELLHHENLNVDGKQDLQIDIFINLIQKPQSVKLRRQHQDNQGNHQHMSPTFSLVRQQLLDFYFLPVEFIPYNATTDFNLQINNFQINEKKSQQITINLREIINVFIADGFFKSQSNYQNSRMSYSELKQLCYFILYKIKKQNFLDLIEKKKIKKPKQQNNLIIKGLNLMDKTQILETPKKITNDNFTECSSRTERVRTFSFNMYPVKSPLKFDNIQSQDSSYSYDDDRRDSVSLQSIRQFDLNQSFLMSRNNHRQSINFLKPLQLFLENSYFKKTIIIDSKSKIFMSTTFYTLQNSFKFVVFRPGYSEKLEKIKNIMYFNNHLFSFKFFFEMKDFKEILRQATLSISQIFLNEYKDLIKKQQN